MVGVVGVVGVVGWWSVGGLVGCWLVVVGWLHWLVSRLCVW